MVDQPVPPGPLRKPHSIEIGYCQDPDGLWHLVSKATDPEGNVRRLIMEHPTFTDEKEALRAALALSAAVEQQLSDAGVPFLDRPTMN